MIPEFELGLLSQVEGMDSFYMTTTLDDLGIDLPQHPVQFYEPLPRFGLVFSPQAFSSNMERAMSEEDDPLLGTFVPKTMLHDQGAYSFIGQIATLDPAMENVYYMIQMYPWEVRGGIVRLTGVAPGQYKNLRLDPEVDSDRYTVAHLSAMLEAVAWAVYNPHMFPIEVNQVRSNRGAAKRARKKGIELSAVRVIDLRPRVSRTRGEHQFGRHLSYRFEVRGFWRNQAYGPKQSLRKSIWIEPYIKGPKNAPIHRPMTVKRF